jgi:hypothetical protein
VPASHRRDRLVEHQGTGDDRDGRVEVGDGGGAHRAHLADQREEQHERGGGADRSQRHHRPDHLAGRERSWATVTHEHDRDVDQRGDRQGRGHDPDPGQPLEGATQDGRPGGVPDDDDPHLAHGAEVGAADVQTDQSGDADDAQGQARPRGRSEAFGPSRRERDGQAGQWYRGDQQARGRAGQPRLRAAEQHPRDGDLHGREHQEPVPPRQQRAYGAAGQSDRHQDQRGQTGPGEHELSRRDLVDGDLDQQVGDSPGHAQPEEQHGGTTRHGAILPGRGRS